MPRNYKTGVLVTGDSTGAVKAVKLTKDQLDSLNDKVKRNNDQVNNSRSAISGYADSLAMVAKRAVATGAALTTLAGVALTRLVKQGNATTDTLAKTAEKLGTTTKALTGLRLAAEQTGVDNKKLDLSLQRLVRRTAEAAAGIGEGKKAFDALGLSAQELVKLKPEEIMGRVADRLNQVENQSQKVALAFKLFDTEGVDLVRTLALGSEGLKEFERQAQILGLSVSENVAQQVENANDSINLISKAVGGFGQQLGAKFAPIIERVTDTLFEWIEAQGGVGKIAERVFKFLIDTSKKVAIAIESISLAWSAVKSAFFSTAAVVAKGFQNLLETIARGLSFFNEDLGRKVQLAADAVGQSFEENSDKAGASIEDLRKKWEGLGETGEQIELVLDDIAFTAERSAQKQIEAQEQVQESLIDTATVNEALAQSASKSANEAAAAWTNAANQIAGALGFSGFGGGIGGGLFNAAFSAFQTGSAGAAGGTGAGANAGLLGILAGGLGGVGGLLSRGFGGLASAFPATSGIGGRFIANNAAFGSRFGLSGNAAIGAGALASVGTGILGGFAGSGLGSALTGKVAESNIGQTIGGVVGSIWGPIGSFIGAGLGSLIDTLAGGDGKRRFNVGILQGFNANFDGNRAVGNVFTAASGLQIQALNRRGGSEGAQAAEQFRDVLLGLDQALTGILGASGIGVDFSNVSLNGVRADAGKDGIGNFFGLKGFNGVEGTLEDAALEFVEAWLEEVNDQLPQRVRSILGGVNGAAEEIVNALQAAFQIDQLLEIDVVRDTSEALETLRNDYGTLLNTYDSLTMAASDLAGEYDGTTGALAELSEALQNQKSVALDLALAYEQLDSIISNTFGSARSAIEESLLNDEELYGLRRQQIDDLTAQLASTIDPEQIASLVGQINQLSGQAFNLLSEDQRAALAPEFLQFLDAAESIAFAQTEAGQAALATSESGLASQIDFALTGSAQQFQQAADTFSDAVDRWVSEGGGGGDVGYAPNSYPNYAVNV